MKWILSVCVFLFMLGVVSAQQSTNSEMPNKLDQLRKTAEQGNRKAQCKLGLCFETGEGVTKDKNEAMKWYRKSAEQGFPPAQLFLGICYNNETNYAEAFIWYQKSAEQGMADAESKLGLSYYSGQGVSRDYTQAVIWFRKAAEQGNTIGQAMLGVCYAYGDGIPINDIEAYKWLNLAAAGEWNSSEDNVRGMVSTMLKTCQERMARAEIVEAQRLAAAFVPKKTNDSKPTISTTTDYPKATGTGFFITDDGYLISNYHVVKDAAKVRLVTGAGLIDAKVVKVDAANDMALLKATGKFALLPIATSRTVKLGGTVATVGFPSTGLQGFSPKLAKGEIGSLAGAYDDPRYFQISVPVQPGNSGGALVDVRGNVVGIVSAKLSAKASLDATGQLPENVNYAVKSSLLLSFLESVPDVSAKLKEPNTMNEAFEDVVKSAQDAAVLVLVY